MPLKWLSFRMSCTEPEWNLEQSLRGKDMVISSKAKATPLAIVFLSIRPP